MKTVKKKIWIIGVLLLCAAMFYTVPVAAAKKTGWKVIKGKTYYFNNDGTMHKGFLKLNGKKYYFGEDGAAKKGFLLLNPLMALCRILPKKIILWLEINGCM